jgi:putative resolvase
MGKEPAKLWRVGKAAQELGLHPITVRRWIKAGRIETLRVGHERRIPRSEIERLKGGRSDRLLVLYGRVSGHGHQEDLARQLARLRQWAAQERPDRVILSLSDIGSGLRPGRRHLQRLLRLVGEGQVGEVAVTFSDRLTRFGQEYLDRYFATFGVTLTVLAPGEDTSSEQELTADLLSLIASFSGRLYGMRSAKQKELIRCAQTVLTNS